MKLASNTPSDDALKRASQSTPRSQPLIRLPDRHNPFSSSDAPSDADKASLPTPKDLLPEALARKASQSDTSPTKLPTPDGSVSQDTKAISKTSNTATEGSQNRKSPANRKVIFASGGICDGYQAQEVLDAGADVAMVYTAMTYGGVGLIARMKGEMVEAREKRHEVDKQGTVR